MAKAARSGSMWVTLSSLSALLLATASCGGRDDGSGDAGDSGIKVGERTTDDKRSTEGETGDESTTDATDSGTPDTTDGTGTDTGTDTPTKDICSSQKASVSQVPTSLMLVLDKSRSMVTDANKWDHDGDEATEPVTRWHSLYEVVRKVTTGYQDYINFGAQLYPAKDAGGLGASACAMAEAPEVAVSVNASDSILAAIPPQGAKPTPGGAVPTSPEFFTGATPAAAGFQIALEHLKEASEGSTSPAAPVMVIVTDGAANCNLDVPGSETCDRNAPDPGPQCSDLWFKTYNDAIHGKVKDAFNNDGIKTYVVGIAIKEGVDDKFQVDVHQKLNQLAQEGGTPHFFSAQNHQELADALDEIVRSVRNCNIVLDSPIDSESVPFVDINLDGETAPLLPDASSCEGLNGWRWDNTNGPNSAIELCGTACEALKAVALVDVEVGCPPAS